MARHVRERAVATSPSLPATFRKMRREERFSAILGRLADGGSVGVAELAQDLGVASATIRRDLALLEQQRLLGGPTGGPSSTPSPTSCPALQGRPPCRGEAPHRSRRRLRT